METLTFLMTTTFYPPHHIGGACIHVRNLADELSKIGHVVHVLYSLDAYCTKTSQYGAMRKNEADTGGDDRVQAHTVKTPLCSTAYTSYGLNYSPLVSRKFEGLVKEIKPDVVHHHEISLLGYGILAKRREYLNLYTAHSYHLICQHGTLFRKEARVCENTNMPNRTCFFCALKYGRLPQVWRHGSGFKKPIREIDYVISPSEYAKTRISRELDSVKTAVIPNFVPNPPQDIAEAKVSQFFLYVGRLERHKGVLELLSLSRRLPHKLVVVGDGPLRSEVSRFIERNALDDRVTYMGHVDRQYLYSLLRDANALLIPSTWPENCPLIALESFSVGTPVVGSSNGGLPEIVGKIDKQLTFEDLHDLKAILQHFDKRRYPPHNVRSIYDKLYSPQAYLRRYKQLLDMR